MNRPKNYYLILLLCSVQTVFAGPSEDLHKFRTFFKERFPTVSFNNFSNGVYAINEDARLSWLDIEEFPPYEEAIEAGKRLFETPFKNNKGYADCFNNGGIGIAQNFPHWDANRNEVITLALAVNDCRSKNGESKLEYKRGEIALLLAYMAFTSREKEIKINIPLADKQALEAYNKGKEFYFQRRGKLNFSCATCHIQNSGLRIRSETLSPMLGHTTGWPAFRAKWGEVGTLHRRFIGCSKQIGSEPFMPQSEEYRNLEYFLTYLGNGLPVNGPSYRK